MLLNVMLQVNFLSFICNDLSNHFLYSINSLEQAVPTVRYKLIYDMFQAKRNL
jgi:hypothetical protein